MNTKVKLKITKKGCIGFYGIRRFPICLYPTEVMIIKFLFGENVIKEFIENEEAEPIKRTMNIFDKFKKEEKSIEIQIKLTEKGCVGFYGIRRFPICLYPDELKIIKKLFDDGKIEEFMCKLSN